MIPFIQGPFSFLHVAHKLAKPTAPGIGQFSSLATSFLKVGMWPKLIQLGRTSGFFFAMPRQKRHREVYNQTQELCQPFFYLREISLKRKMTHKERSQSPVKAIQETRPPAGLFSYITQYRSPIFLTVFLIQLLVYTLLNPFFFLEFFWFSLGLINCSRRQWSQGNGGDGGGVPSGW